MGIPNDEEVKLNTGASKWIWIGLVVVVLIAAALIFLAVRGGDDEEEGETTANNTGDLTVLDPWVRPPMSVMAGTEEARMAATEEAGAVTSAEDQPSAGGMAASTLMTAAYMAIANDSNEDDRLLSVSTDVAARVEIHETTIENDVASMRPLPAGLPIGAGETVELSPGGVHLMLLDLNTDLAPGMVVSLTLRFASGAELTVNAPVQAPEE